MAHDIWNNQMVYAGEVPWHGLGKQIPSDLTGEELQRELNLSRIDKRPLYTVDENGKLLCLPDHVATVRAKDNVVLGPVGKDFTPIQDGEVIDMLDLLRQEGMVNFHTAGILAEGSRFFVCLDIPGGVMKLRTPNGKEDTTVDYLLFSHGHDGSLAAEFSPTKVRVVCQNTVSMARAEAKRNRVSFYIKHTATANARVQLAIQAYKRSMEFVKQTQERAQKLVDTSFNDTQMKQLTEGLFPIKPGTDDIPAQTLKARYEVTRLFVEGKGHVELALVGTAWGAYNAVTEYLDWNRPTRGLKEASDVEKTERRMNNAWFSGPVVDKKLEALERIEALAAA